MQGRPGSQHIIDDDIAGVWVDGQAVGDNERARDILSSLLSAEAGLRDGLMLFAEEELSPAPRDMFGEDSGNSFRLIISAIKLPGGVQGDRYEYRPSQVPPEVFVREGRVGKVVGQEGAPFVFDAMDNPAGGAAGAEGADRPGEGGLEIKAMRAGPVAFEDAFEGVPAGQAAGVGDPGELVGPGGGEVQASVIVHRFLRDRAVPGEDQVKEPAVEVSQPAHPVRPLASGVYGRAPTRSRLPRWR